MREANSKGEPRFGMLSLIFLFLAIVLGVFKTAAILSRTSEMGSWSALDGVAAGFMASTVSLVFAVIGLLRHEQPVWPAALGLVLSVLPGIYGFSIIWQKFYRFYVG